MERLRFDLQRTSEFLFDLTNGQTALGNITIYQDAKRYLTNINPLPQPWLEADIRIYASNRLRPNASIGGLVGQKISDPDKPDSEYTPGQVRMGAVWSRYGQSQSLGEDWSRALAHELGHYLFFLEDNYLGFDEQTGLLKPVPNCLNSAMTDAYREDFSEFLPTAERLWTEACQKTLAGQRSDWETIQTFYPGIFQVQNNPGPAALPLAVTQIREEAFPLPPNSGIPRPLDVPIFYLTDASGALVDPGPEARAYLYQDEQAIELGCPRLDQITAHGARPGDRLCVYESTSDDSSRWGCEIVSTGDNQLRLTQVEGWQPDIRISVVTSTTITVQVTAGTAITPGSGERLLGQLYPLHMTATLTATFLLDNTTGIFSHTFHLEDGDAGALVKVWAASAASDEVLREAVSGYALGGSPRGRAAASRSSPGK